MSKAAVEMGFNGLDITVRKGGHVAPDHVETDLQKVAKAMQEVGLSTTLITTNITDATTPKTKRILETASKLEFTNYGID
ncbi:hypothetical protein [Cellulophaga sp. Z1A5H]|uniref:hypothetical protein n=1 Tax=Cellulophaga sp. Z1A5H TaxID=2687291 RepID=UPI0013FD41FE|nr:hypothetical protein [Cellulophaga sp. Z1A5H]